jgi:2-methylisocitrate lyase-like PEP mutase family enzyme
VRGGHHAERARQFRPGGEFGNFAHGLILSSLAEAVRCRRSLRASPELASASGRAVWNVRRSPAWVSAGWQDTCRRADWQPAAGASALWQLPEEGAMQKFERAVRALNITVIQINILSSKNGGSATLRVL